MITATIAWPVFLAGLWLIGVGAFMLVWPHRALAVLARMGSSPAIHFGEMAIRLVVGIALVLTASATRFPLVITTIGAFLIVTAILLSLLPRRWHAAYSTAWARRIPPWTVHLLGPLSWAMGAALIWAAA